MLGDCPGEAQPVEGRRAAADLVEDDEAARRGAVQDVRRLLHLDHEGRLAARDVVGRADAGEDPIDDRQLGAAARHERPGLRHEAEQCGLAEIGGLAAHVRSGEDDELVRRRVERHVVRHERVARRAARRPDAARRRRRDRRRRAPSAWCSSARPPSRPAPPAHRAPRVPEPCPESAAPSAATCVRRASKIASSRSRIRSSAPSTFSSYVLQRGRDEPLAAGDGLLSVIVGRHVGEVRLRDLDVVPEDAVVADLQRGDPVRARSASSIAAMRCLLERLMLRRSSSSGVDAVANRRRRPARRPAARRGASIELVAEVASSSSSAIRLRTSGA